MTRPALLLLVPAVSVLSVFLAPGVEHASAHVVAGVAGTVVAIALWVADRQAVRAVARRVNRWVGDDDAAALELTGGAAWRELATAVNAVRTQLRAVDAELRSVVPWTERLVASLDEPAFVFGPDGRLVAVNEAGDELSGIATDGPAPTALATLGVPAMAAAVGEAVASALLVEVHAEHAGHDLRITASPLDDHVLVVVSDHTRERQVEALRRDFVVNASHELKTPVTAIVTLTDALRVAPEDRRVGLLDRLDEESQRLARLVHDLLDLRLLDETAPRERAPVDLVLLVDEALAAAAAAAAAARVTIRTDLPGSAIVVGERHGLALAVTNLITNAVRYNREGGAVTVALEPQDGEQVLTVSDTGLGIPSAALDRIFERFYRVDAARSRASGGTGLGLSIVRNAVERHGGDVRVESLLGVGTTFTVRLPVEPA